jgi:hypothetical protein
MDPQISPQNRKYANITTMILLCVYSKEVCPSVTEDKGILDEIEGQPFDIGTNNGGPFDVFQYAPLLGKLSRLVELSAVTG